MTKGVWLGGLLLAAGWASRLDAQPSPWRTSGPQPTPVAWTGSEPAPFPTGRAAALGRPIPIATARPVPPAAPGVLQASYQTASPPATTERTPPPLPARPDEGEAAADQPGLIDPVSLFASDRFPPPPPPPAPGSLLRTSKQVVANGEPLPAPPRLGEKLPDAELLGVLPPPLPGPKPEVPAVDGPVPDPLHPHFYARAEYLLWGIRPYHVPPLASTGDVNNLGILGQGGRVIFGDANLAGGLRSGLRLDVGCWADMWCEDGFDLGAFYLGERVNRFATNSNQNPIIARPFFDLNNQREFVQLVSFPGLQTGTLTVEAPSRFLGAELNYHTKVCCGCDYRADLLFGFRFLNLDESVTITENINFSGNPALGALANQQGKAVDRFHTTNQFWGGQVGASGEKHWGPWSVEGRFKLGLGGTGETVRIDGSQVFTPNSALNAVGGLLALPSNIGHRERSVFTVVPELDLNVGYQVNEHVRAFIGYDILYWSSVVRPGDQIDRVLDVTTIPNFTLTNGQQPTGSGRPALPFKETGFWAQGLNFGIEFRY